MGCLLVNNSSLLHDIQMSFSCDAHCAQPSAFDNSFLRHRTLITHETCRSPSFKRDEKELSKLYEKVVLLPFFPGLKSKLYVRLRLLKIDKYYISLSSTDF